MPDTAARSPDSGPVLLCLDTATERLHAALTLADGGHLSLELPGGAQASSTLLPALSSMLTEAGLPWSSLDGLAFGAGPGAFTGLRTACATVQGLALGLDRPVLSLDTLMLVAEDARLSGRLDLTQPLWALQDARMGELYAAAYRWADEHWQVEAEPQLWALDVALSRVAEAALPWAGNALQADAARLAPLQATMLPGATGGTAAPRGAALASLAARAWLRGEAIDAALALPRYVRNKVAQTTAERAAERAGAVAAAEAAAVPARP